jgi:hypothetical protein
MVINLNPGRLQECTDILATKDSPGVTHCHPGVALATVEQQRRVLACALTPDTLLLQTTISRRLAFWGSWWPWAAESLASRQAQSS